MGGLFEILFNFLVDLCKWFLEGLFNSLALIVNYIIAGVSAILDAIISMFPSSCGIQLNIPPALTEILGYISWFIPLSALHQCVATFCCGMIAYVTVRPILKFLQLT